MGAPQYTLACPPEIVADMLTASNPGRLGGVTTNLALPPVGTLATSAVSVMGWEVYVLPAAGGSKSETDGAAGAE